VNQLSFCQNVTHPGAVLQSALSACHSLPTSSLAPPFLYPL
jgi:organic hydroperoxide reductase OsmC/OhrA